jgi:P4 family phage/plasmid primase-like protien
VSLSGYWREYHADAAIDLLTRLNERMLRDSLLHMRGRTERKGAFHRQPGRYVIHLRNGMLHLDDMKLRDFALDYYSRNMIPFELDEKAECPRFLDELMYAALPEDDVDLLQRWAGTVLMGGNPTQQFMLVEGTAGGGKGTFSEIIETMVGYENVAELRTYLLNERFEMSAFIGKSLLCGKDVPGDFLQVRGADAIKKLVGHDCMQAEQKRVNQRTQVFGDFAIMITSNDRLKVRLNGDADAWRRRILMVRYERPPATKPIPGFARTLIEKEGPGILAWMVAGAVKAIADIRMNGRLTLNERQQRMVDSIIFESDGLQRFVDEGLERCKGWDVTTEEMKSAYVRYCERSGWSMLPGHNVERLLPDLILATYNVHKSNSLMRDDKSARGYRGLRIRDALR